MHYFTVLIALCTIFASHTVSARCYTSGVRWTNRERVYDYIVNKVCTGDALSKYYEPSIRASYCIDDPDGYSANFYIVRFLVGAWLSPEMCVERLANEVFGCEYGGKKYYDDVEYEEGLYSEWGFEADPNEGSCYQF